MRLIKICAFSTVLIILIVSSTPQGRSGVKAALFISHILTEFKNSPLTLFTKDVKHQEISFISRLGRVEADLYLPGGNSTHPGIVFFMGLVPPERDEDRIVRLGEGLARSGMVVMIPWLETQETNQLSTRDIESLVESFQYLEAHPRVERDSIGMGGICTGASMSIIAAQDVRINDRVKFVNSFAGYYDAFDLIVSTSSKTQLIEQNVVPWDPDSLTSNMISKHLLTGLDQQDKVKIASIVSSNQASKPYNENLPKDAEAALQLISGGTRQTATKYISDLNKETQSFLTRISPSTDIENLKAHLLLMHDTHDRLIPSGESRRLAAAVEQNGGSVYHTEFSLFQEAVKVHTDNKTHTESTYFIGEAWKLFLHMYNVMKLMQ